MRRFRIPFAAATAALILVLGACGSAPEARERFEEAPASSGDRWRDAADAIMADGRVTRAETEQAFASYAQCMEEQGFYGDWSIDLDIYYWGKMSYGLDPETPGYQPLPERFRKKDWTAQDYEDFPEWFNSAEGQERERSNQRIVNERKAACAPFDEVEQMANAAVDWGSYDRAEFDAVVRCIAANAPRYADRARQVRYAFGDATSGMDALRDAFYGPLEQRDDAFVDPPESSEERRVVDCFNNPNGVPTHYFGSDEYNGSGDRR
ncbi:hypothetical protein G1C96_0346 [Bifidobacterium sp. DSM 109958]|uniref:Lipoprotein n=1 Tax=Bifidobacterium moraviense TaxID=2675323 RepID=A0A7Y0HYH3_9BIFI|nr:hypothetical protein [Bifidobacterium sp. DSM 109958]NMM99768.1 hypothetical protein [Bifidobacterium sp. DSM 109958]